MATVRFTQHLSRFFPGLAAEERVAGATVAEVVDALDRRHAGIRGYLCGDDGALRKHVNIFVDGDMVHDRRGLSDPVGDATDVVIMQALSGG